MDEHSPAPEVTIEDVARHAGVSPSTVSRILNGTARVRDSKRRAVEQAIADLQYHPNVIARGLASGHTMSVGVITQDIASPFYNETLKGIEDSLAKAGYSPLFVSGHGNAEKEVERMTLLVARRVEGVIVLNPMMDDEALLNYSQRLPLVTTGHPLQGPRLTRIQLSNEQAAFEATWYLIELGHTRIAHIAGPDFSIDGRARLAGYRRALSQAGLPVDERLIAFGNFHESGGLAAVHQLLERGGGFSALFVANDQMAYGARLALYSQSLRVPEDVSLVGFDDLPGSLYTTPPLTTVRQPAYDLGNAAGEAMLRMIHGQPVSLPELPLHLIVRESTLRRPG